MDINVDLGESLDFLENGIDEQFMQLADSVNIACTFHAGSDYIIAKTLEKAIENHCRIGFHTGFYDRENFGRIERELDTEALKSLVFKQYDIFSKIALPMGVKISHHKPHGALYNMSAKRPVYAAALAEATKQIDPNLILYGLYGSDSIRAAENLGLPFYKECFADRAYHNTGHLVNRNLNNAVLVNEGQIKNQIKGLLSHSSFLSYEGQYISIKADSICVHSDSPSGLKIAKMIKEFRDNETKF
jgi:5-oxoprolinase (ATP-hydrolysing) subunit A